MPTWFVALAGIVAFAGCGGASPPAGSCAPEGPSSWPYRAAVPSKDCATRAPTRCTASDVAADSALTSLDTIAISACGGPGTMTLRIEVQGGCPTLLEARPQNPPLSATEDDYLACFVAMLAKLRFDCTTRTTCSTLDFTRPPANPPFEP